MPTVMLGSFRQYLRVLKVQSGFTLVEIMVALAVLAISGVAILSTISQATTDLSKLDDKLVALNIAQFTVDSVLVTNEYPQLGKEDTVVTRADRDWLVQIEVSQTENENVRRIDVRVLPESAEYAKQDSATVLLSAFMADIK